VKKVKTKTGEKPFCPTCGVGVVMCVERDREMGSGWNYRVFWCDSCNFYMPVFIDPGGEPMIIPELCRSLPTEAIGEEVADIVVFR